MFRIEDLNLRELQPVEDTVYVTQNDSFDGYTISEYIQILWASVNFKMTDAANYIDVVKVAREKAYSKIVETAQSKGANAIISFKFNTLVKGNNVEISVTGNAVKIEPVTNFVPSGDVGMMIEKVLNSYMKKEKESAKQAKGTTFGLI